MLEYENYVNKKRHVTCRDLLLPDQFISDNPFSFWNVGSNPKFCNCYTLACDALLPDLGQLFGIKKDGATRRKHQREIRFSIHIPRPGTTGGNPFSVMSVGSLKSGLIADGFVALPYTDQEQIDIPPQHYLIAGYYSGKDNDYHFYRYYEPKQEWYHKPGWKYPVINRDDSNKIIKDVQKADKGNYREFVGFFLSPPNRPPLNIIIKDSRGKVLFGSPPI